jgi:hypothetical protein
MKKVVNFLNHTSLTKVAIVGYLFWTLLTIVLFKLTDKFILDSQLDFNQTLKIGLIIGLLINVMFTIVVYNDRKSKSFWNYSNFIENLIENSKSK